MQVILLERIAKLGQMGDVVDVKHNVVPLRIALAWDSISYFRSVHSEGRLMT